MSSVVAGYIVRLWKSGCFWLITRHHGAYTQLCAVKLGIGPNKGSVYPPPSEAVKYRDCATFRKGFWLPGCQRNTNVYESAQQ